jgi:hypothetical protein
MVAAFAQWLANVTGKQIMAFTTERGIGERGRAAMRDHHHQEELAILAAVSAAGDYQRSACAFGEQSNEIFNYTRWTT